VVTLRPERGEAKRIPLAAVKEARLAFPILIAVRYGSSSTILFSES